MYLMVSALRIEKGAAMHPKDSAKLNPYKGF